jgi:hypothetical protein
MMLMAYRGSAHWKNVFPSQQSKHEVTDSLECLNKLDTSRTNLEYESGTR